MKNSKPPIFKFLSVCPLWGYQNSSSILKIALHVFSHDSYICYEYIVVFNVKMYHFYPYHYR